MPAPDPAAPAAAPAWRRQAARLWPRSLASRTALVVLIGLALVQVAGLTIHAFDRMDLQLLAERRDAALRAISLYRTVVVVDRDRRAAATEEIERNPGEWMAVETHPPLTDLPPTPPETQRLMRSAMLGEPLPPALRPRETSLSGGMAEGRVDIGLSLPEGEWLNMRLPLRSPQPWHSSGFLIGFLLMTATAAALILWAVRRLIAPVVTLSHAAEALGRDVNAPPLPETGPVEVATAAAAFNTMAARIRRFVQDRTFLLTAIGHDLRTPITRMKLRAEFLEDDELRRQLLADLDELEAMVSATLSFGRDAAADEAVAAVDLAELARTVLEEIGDARPGQADRLDYRGPDRLPVRVRPLAMKRALTNLVANALNYGGNARILLAAPPSARQVELAVEDDGPGVPEAEIERLFQPFHRLEESRNRETGGTGLGLPIARNILRAHGGDVTLANRPGGGVRVLVTLPP